MYILNAFTKFVVPQEPTVRFAVCASPLYKMGYGVQDVKSEYKDAVPVPVQAVPVRLWHVVVLFKEPSVTLVISSSAVIVAAEVQ